MMETHNRSVEWGELLPAAIDALARSDAERLEALCAWAEAATLPPARDRSMVEQGQRILALSLSATADNIRFLRRLARVPQNRNPYAIESLDGCPGTSR